VKNVISITEARKRLPGIIKSLKTSPGMVYQITVHDEIVAEIRTPPKIKPGEAAARLLELRKRLGSKKYKTKPVSEKIKEHLYVAEGD
jgi:antitoxin (DNA-binding transcriptional repressor) of toxin-antitoxin stability system